MYSKEILACLLIMTSLKTVLPTQVLGSSTTTEVPRSTLASFDCKKCLKTEQPASPDPRCAGCPKTKPTVQWTKHIPTGSTTETQTTTTSSDCGSIGLTPDECQMIRIGRRSKPSKECFQKWCKSTLGSLQLKLETRNKRAKISWTKYWPATSTKLPITVPISSGAVDCGPIGLTPLECHLIRIGQFRMPAEECFKKFCQSTVRWIKHQSTPPTTTTTQKKTGPIDCGPIGLTSLECQLIQAGKHKMPAEECFKEFCQFRPPFIQLKFVTRKKRARTPKLSFSSQSNQQSPLFKLVRDIDTTTTPILTNEQWQQYQKSLEDIKAKQSKNFETIYINTSDNVTVTLLLAIISVGVFALVLLAIWIACCKKSNRTLYKEPFSRLPVKLLDYMKV